MKSRMILGILFVLNIVFVSNVEASEITGAEIEKYVEKAPKLQEVKPESKADLGKYKVQDQGNKVTLEQETIKVEIPKNIAEPVVLKGKEQSNTGKKAEDIKITMPQAKGSKATKEKKGVVGYESKDNFTNIVEPTKEGVRLLTVIENKNAPERYEYKLDIKGGYVLAESFGENGKKGIAVLKADQSDLIAMIDTAWAKDANGKDIETYYEIKGNTIVQIVKHKVKGTVYPVSADPEVWIWWFGNTYYESNRWDMKIWFNRTQTNKLIWAGSVGTLISGGITALPTPVTTVPGWGITSVVGLNTANINYWYNEGKCVAMTINKDWVWIWPWHNKHCK